jgi:hypothetical protein
MDPVPVWCVRHRRRSGVQNRAQSAQRCVERRCGINVDRARAFEARDDIAGGQITQDLTDVLRATSLRLAFGHQLIVGDDGDPWRLTTSRHTSFIATAPTFPGNLRMIGPPDRPLPHSRKYRNGSEAWRRSRHALLPAAGAAGVSARGLLHDVHHRDVSGTCQIDVRALTMEPDRHQRHPLIHHRDQSMVTVVHGVT